MTDRPERHTEKPTDEMRDLVTHLRADVGKVDDPRAQALFETSAEVVEGLINGVHDYDERNEEAWRD